jgi:hypothetical protein
MARSAGARSMASIRTLCLVDHVPNDGDGFAAYAVIMRAVSSVLDVVTSAGFPKAPRRPAAIG